MAETTYTYSIAGDTANSKVVASKLQNEIQATSTILISLNRVETVGDDLDIIFNAALDSGELGTLDTIVAAHDGVPYTTVTQVHEITTLDPNVDRTLVIKGVHFLADLSTTTTHDLQFGEDRELQGGACYVKNHAFGDYLEMTVHIPDSAETQVSQFGETVYVPHNGEIVPWPSMGTNLIPAGLIIRLTYVSVDSGGPSPEVVCHLRTHK